jgi:hypothetical protein
LGATLGILSGGVTLIGGALVGVTAGALTGALFHKGVGLSDDDKNRLEEHLMNGGAAVVAMADEDEVAATAEELTRLGGDGRELPGAGGTCRAVGSCGATTDVAGDEVVEETPAADAAEERLPANVNISELTQVRV